MSMKNSIATIGNRTRDLPTCSAVPPPTSPPRSPSDYFNLLESCELCMLYFIMCSMLYSFFSLEPYIKENTLSTTSTVTSLLARTSRRTVSLKRYRNHGNMRKRSVVTMTPGCGSVTHWLTHSVIQSHQGYIRRYQPSGQAPWKTINVAFWRQQVRIVGEESYLDENIFLSLTSPPAKLGRY
jgi:hypothetical protein